jgi:CheY-like chemotaxis protein
MSIKHALVVDDSKAARVALKRLLEQYELVVELAESGEEALDFLKQQTVDVIFMDHTMPGMDGLAAVKAIKSNPRTAMIPVLMYTTREGEVYVGQARALGAIGVLPKNVQPHVLFDMLLNLGLVKDKRSDTSSDASAPQRRATDAAPLVATPPAASDEPTGFALEAVLQRTLEDQKLLRAELMLREDELAKRIASEVLDAQRARGLPAIAAVDEPATAGWQLLVVLFAIAAIGLGVMAWQARDEVDAARAAADQSGDAVHDLGTELHTERTRSRAQFLSFLDTLQWALNQNASFRFDELPFDGARAEELGTLLERLAALGFRGRVRIEAHLGEFCLVADEAQQLTLAPADAPVESCDHIGHPLDASSFVSERQSVEFAQLVTGSTLIGETLVELELVAHDRDHSLRRHQFPAQVSRAGDWNRIAEANNRVEYTLIPTQ